MQVVEGLDELLSFDVQTMFPSAAVAPAREYFAAHGVHSVHNLSMEAAATLYQKSPPAFPCAGDAFVRLSLRPYPGDCRGGQCVFLQMLGFPKSGTEWLENVAHAFAALCASNATKRCAVRPRLNGRNGLTFGEVVRDFTIDHDAIPGRAAYSVLFSKSFKHMFPPMLMETACARSHLSAHSVSSLKLPNVNCDRTHVPPLSLEKQCAARTPSTLAELTDCVSSCYRGVDPTRSTTRYLEIYRDPRELALSDCTWKGLNFTALGGGDARAGLSKCMREQFQHTLVSVRERELWWRTNPLLRSRVTRVAYERLRGDESALAAHREVGRALGIEASDAEVRAVIAGTSAEAMRSSEDVSIKKIACKTGHDFATKLCGEALNKVQTAGAVSYAERVDPQTAQFVDGVLERWPIEEWPLPGSRVPPPSAAVSSAAAAPSVAGTAAAADAAAAAEAATLASAAPGEGASDEDGNIRKAAWRVLLQRGRESLTRMGYPFAADGRTSANCYYRDPERDPEVASAMEAYADAVVGHDGEFVLRSASELHPVLTAYYGRVGLFGLLWAPTFHKGVGVPHNVQHLLGNFAVTTERDAGRCGGATNVSAAVALVQLFWTVSGAVGAADDGDGEGSSGSSSRRRLVGGLTNEARIELEVAELIMKGLVQWGGALHGVMWGGVASLRHSASAADQTLDSEAVWRWANSGLACGTTTLQALKVVSSCFHGLGHGLYIVFSEFDVWHGGAAHSAQVKGRLQKPDAKLAKEALFRGLQLCGPGDNVSSPHARLGARARDTTPTRADLAASQSCKCAQGLYMEYDVESSQGSQLTCRGMPYAVACWKKFWDTAKDVSEGREAPARFDGSSRRLHLAHETPWARRQLAKRIEGGIADDPCRYLRQPSQDGRIGVDDACGGIGLREGRDHASCAYAWGMACFNMWTTNFAMFPVREISNGQPSQISLAVEMQMRIAKSHWSPRNHSDAFEAARTPVELFCAVYDTPRARTSWEAHLSWRACIAGSFSLVRQREAITIALQKQMRSAVDAGNDPWERLWPICNAYSRRPVGPAGPSEVASLCFESLVSYLDETRYSPCGEQVVGAPRPPRWPQ